MALPPPISLHYDNQLDFDLARLNLGVAIAFGALAAIAVVLRFIARKQIKVSLQEDDWVVFVATTVSIAQCMVSAWASIQGGLGVPAQYLSQNTSVLFLKMLQSSAKFHAYLFQQTFVQELLSTAAIGLIKISVCLYYKRIFSADRTFLKCIYVMIIVSACWTLVFFFLLAFRLWPVWGNWFINRGVESNMNFGALVISMAVTSVALDLTILSMPVPMICKLQMSSRRKLVVGSILGLGAFCVVAAVVRLAYIVQFLQIQARNPTDAFSHAESQIAVWSNIEPCASVLCACLPTYGPLLEKLKLSRRNKTGIGIEYDR